MFNRMTIIFLAAFLFFGFFADSSYAANPNERCLELVSEAKSEPKTNFEVWTCIDNSDESQRKLSEKIEAGGIEVIVALDVTRLNLSNQDFLKLSKSESFDLIIDGICTGKCSRILLPLARKTTFSSGSFAILDKSSIEGLTVKGAKQMKAIRLLGGPAAAVDLRDVNEIYIEEFKNQFLPELEIIVNSKVNVTHLLWHNFISRTSKRSRVC